MTEVEAAKFVGVHRRTLRRYEVEDGLPVHRLGSSGRGPKRYFRDELTAWMRRNRWFGIAADNEGVA